ncbi:MAG: FAD-binding protein [Rhodospirillales bacterium]|nr:FAD-binding protein [Rhodospirillales bacterium]
MSDPEYDLIAIGGGFAGLTAAARAQDLGLKCLVLERDSEDRYLCNSRITSGVFHVASNDVRLGPEDLAPAIEKETAGYAKPELVQTIAVNAARTVEWLRGAGVKFVAKGVGYVNMRQHMVLAPPRRMRAGLDWEGRGGDFTLRALEAFLIKYGGAVDRGAEVTRLLMEDGRCIGAEVKAGGKLKEITARAVVIADGGFQANPEMLRGSVTGAPDRVRLRATPSGTGDGIRMAQDVGAAVTALGDFYGHLLSATAMTNEALWPYPNIDIVAVAGVMVDGNGRRFVDESRGGVFLSNAVAKLDDPLSATLVMTKKIWDEIGTDGIAPPNPLMVKHGGTLIEAPDLGALAAAIQVPADALKTTLDGYNQAFHSGNLGTLSPQRDGGRHQAYPVEEGPYCAIRLCAGVTNTMGGIEIDQHCRVLGKDGAPIAGLYAAGSSTGGLEGGPNVGYVGGLVKAFVFGMVAGEHIAGEIDA